MTIATEARRRVAEKAADTEAKSNATLLTSPYIKQVKSDAEVHEPKLNLDALRKSLPKEVFEKNLRRSLQWMVWDMSIVFGLLWLGKTVYDSQAGILSSGLAKFAIMSALFLVTGFFQWCVFVVGHDCGHSSFSEYPSVNFLCGLITHGSIMVPYSAWQRSHRFHHMYHNHETKDYSFSWVHDPAYDSPGARFLHNDSMLMQFVRAVVFPFIAYAYYLGAPEEIFGAPVGVDGCHLLPFASMGRLWKDCSTRDVIECFASVGAMGFWAVFFTQAFYDGSFLTFCTLYLPCWFWFCFFLFTVTYLQHHSPDTKIYDETTWTYATAAFETVDRKYGHYIDLLHHHISDGHVVHHLFFTKIPHYNLGLATDSMVKWLEANGLKHLYKKENTQDFMLRVMKYMWRSGLRATLITKKEFAQSGAAETWKGG